MPRLENYPKYISAHKRTSNPRDVTQLLASTSFVRERRVNPPSSCCTSLSCFALLLRPQPLRNNVPVGFCVAHNGHLSNGQQLREQVRADTKTYKAQHYKPRACVQRCDRVTTERAVEFYDSSEDDFCFLPNPSEKREKYPRAFCSNG